MPTSTRLQPWIDEVKAAGLRGESMQAVLSKVARREDLSPHLIRRVAEAANREVHVAITKDAHKTKQDARLRFELCDPEALIKDVRSKTAEADDLTGDQRVLASKVAAVQQTGGDPFATPVIYATSVKTDIEGTEDLVAQRKLSELTLSWQQLDRAEREYTGLKKEAAQALIDTVGMAQDGYNRAAQSAIDMVTHGVTVPSMYRAILATVAGSASTDAQNQQADQLMKIVLEGLKARGVPNHRLGFRYRADLGAIDALSIDDLLSLCQRAVAYDRGHCPLTKTAAKYLTVIYPPSPQTPSNSQHYDQAVTAADKDNVLPQSYLDEKNTSNTPPGGVRVFNADSEFIIAVRDLVGAQDRLRKLRNSDEYFGLKLEEIAAAKCDVEDTHKALEKVAVLGALAGAGRAIAGSGAGQMVSKAVSALEKPGITNAVGIANVGAAAAPYALKTRDARDAEKTQGRGAGTSGQATGTV